MGSRGVLVGLAAVALALSGSAAAGSQPPAPSSRSLSVDFLAQAAALAVPKGFQPSLAHVPAAADVPVPDGHSATFPGLVTCQAGSAKYYPVYSEGHALTVTRSYIFTATSPDFLNAVQSASSLWLVQIGADYWHVPVSNPAAADGPKSYEHAWVSRGIAAGNYVAVVNLAYYVDGDAITGVDAFLLEAAGANAVSPSTCFFP